MAFLVARCGQQDYQVCCYRKSVFFGAIGDHNVKRGDYNRQDDREFHLGLQPCRQRMPTRSLPIFTRLNIEQCTRPLLERPTDDLGLRNI